MGALVIRSSWNETGSGEKKKKKRRHRFAGCFEMADAIESKTLLFTFLRISPKDLKTWFLLFFMIRFFDSVPIIGWKYRPIVFYGACGMQSWMIRASDETDDRIDGRITNLRNSLRIPPPFPSLQKFHHENWQFSISRNGMGATSLERPLPVWCDTFRWVFCEITYRWTPAIECPSRH